MPLTEEMLTILPPPPATMARATAWQVRNRPVWLTAVMWFQVARSTSKKPPRWPVAGGVVDQDVDAAEFGEDSRYHSLHRIR